MKNILITLIAAITLGYAAPAIASEANLALRGVEKATPTQTEAPLITSVPGSQAAAAAKKVRVVLASPYSN